jgi:hypothetical protein
MGQVVLDVRSTTRGSRRGYGVRFVSIREITWSLARLLRYIADNTVASISRINTRLVLSRTANTSGS